MQSARQPLCLPACSTTKFYPISCSRAQGHTGRVYHAKAPDPQCWPVTEMFVTTALHSHSRHSSSSQQCQSGVTLEGRHRARVVPQLHSHLPGTVTPSPGHRGQGRGQAQAALPAPQGTEQGWAAHAGIGSAVHCYKSITFSLSSQVLLLSGAGQGQHCPGQQCLSCARHSAPSCPPQAPRFSGISMETRCAKRYKARISFPSSFHSSRTFVHLIVTYFTGTRQQGQSLTHHCAA